MSNVTKEAFELQLQGLGPDALASQIAEAYVQWDTGKNKARIRWKEVTEYVFAIDTRTTTNVSAPWSHTTHIPKLTQIYDNLGANYSAALFGNRDFFDFDPGNLEAAVADKRRKVRFYLQSKHALSGFRETMDLLLDDYVHYGNSFAKLEYVRLTVGEGASERTVYEGPKLFRISPLDIVFDYQALSFASAPKIVRSLVSRGELFDTANIAPERAYDPAALEKARSYSGLCYSTSPGELNKIEQRRFDGFDDFASYFRSGKVEILEFFGDIYDPVTKQLHKNVVITVADRRFVLRKQPLSDLGSVGQIYHVGWRRRPDNLWAMGPLDNLVGMQYLIDHLENARADAFDQMLTPDRVIKGAVRIEKVGASINYIIDGGEGDVRNLAPDATALNADFQIERKEAQMEAYAGAPREAMGIRSPGEKTAFEIQSLQNAASRLFQHKIEQFETLVEAILNGELELGARNLSRTDSVRSEASDGTIDFLDVTKADLTVVGAMRARGASHFAKRAQLVQELQGFENVLAVASDLKLHFPAEQRAAAWNDALRFDNYGLYKPFGALAEQVEAQKRSQVAQNELDSFTAAGEIAEAEQTV